MSLPSPLLALVLAAPSWAADPAAPTAEQIQENVDREDAEQGEAMRRLLGGAASPEALRQAEAASALEAMSTLPPDPATPGADLSSKPAVVRKDDKTVTFSTGNQSRYDDKSKSWNLPTRGGARSESTASSQRPPEAGAGETSAYQAGLDAGRKAGSLLAPGLPPGAGAGLQAGAADDPGAAALAAKNQARVQGELASAKKLTDLTVSYVNNQLFIQGRKGDAVNDLHHSAAQSAAAQNLDAREAAGGDEPAPAGTKFFGR